MPLSDAARAAGDALFPLCLTGGDAYELAMAVPDDGEQALRAAGVEVTRIGRFIDGPPRVEVRQPDGLLLSLPSGGWSHFS